MGPELGRLNAIPSGQKAPEERQTALGRAGRLAAVAAVLAAAVALRIPLCPFAIVTRHPCPGCGLTRAGLALAQGHVGDALHNHPLAIPIIPLVALVIAQGSYTYVRHGKWRTFAEAPNRIVTIGAIVLGFAMLAVWLARFVGFFGGPVPV